MSFNFNKAILGGRITHDLDLRQPPGGMSVLRFVIASSRPRRKGSEEVTDFIEASAFGEQAEFISRNFKKGSNILVCGAIHVNRWETKNGDKRQTTEIAIEEVSFVDPYEEKQYAPVSVPRTGKQVGMQIPQTSVGRNTGASFEDIPDDDKLPF